MSDNITYCCPNCGVIDTTKQTVEYTEGIITMHCGICKSNRYIGVYSQEEDK